ncbi:MAG: [FeFe] hydrogenase H-cluster maturation GTPase HydF [Clostridia bacterium]|nr:[FeFe] hydrogenase H-cluster maturation GTPase HydF [Clostridia bacterium]
MAGLNDTPRAERVTIGVFGRRNAGKSSLVNAFTGQRLSIVSSTPGTTTDPVYKSMELLPAGPVTIVDTPGIDDVGETGKMRVEASLRVLGKCDCAIVVADINSGLCSEDERLIEEIKRLNLPYIIAYNKCDEGDFETGENEICVSAKTRRGIDEMRQRIVDMVSSEAGGKRIVGGFLDEGDSVILVVPIDSAAPKGRLILPQQQTIRDILDAGARAVVIKEDALVETLDMLKCKPKMVICDSQVFGKVAKDTPEDVALTSFSILFANYKGDLAQNVRGAKAIDNLRDGDLILISEGCTHHRQCDDIGSVKIPAWLQKYTGKKLNFEFSSGGDFPENIKKYAAVIHCGGCMLNEKEMRRRMRLASEQVVPIVNYGIAIAYMHGILERSVRIFPEVHDIL